MHRIGVVHPVVVDVAECFVLRTNNNWTIDDGIVDLGGIAAVQT